MKTENQTVDIEKTELEWLESFSTYATDHLKIQTMEGDLIKFKMNEVQTVLHEIMEDIKAKGRLTRIVVLKARREGISTYAAGRYYWKTATNMNRYAMMITHEPEATDFLFGMHKRFQAHNEWKPTERYNNKRILEFNTQDGKGLDSAIRVATAGKEDVGSAQLVHYLHLSEVAKWPTHTTDAILTSVLQCVPDTDDSEVIFESTAKGIGGAFYEKFWSCRYQYTVRLGKHKKPEFTCEINEDADENNEYSAVFFPWFVFRKYQMDVPEGFKRTEEEEKLVELYKITDKQLMWRRWAIENKCYGDEKVFMQEYPSNPEEAFISSGDPVFDPHQILALMKTVPEPVARYELLLSTGQWYAEKEGKLKVWEEPRPGEPYIVPADVAEGLEHGDYSVAYVIHQVTGQMCAQWRGHIDADQFAVVMAWLGRRYNTAYLVPERNNHGQTVVLKLLDMGYPKIYVERIPDPPNRPRKRYGWLTGRSNKSVLIDNLIMEMREGTHGINSKDLLREMLTFKKDEQGRYGAEEGKHDDCVMGYSIGKHTRTRLPLPTGFTRGRIEAEKHWDNVPSGSAPPVGAWT